MRLPKRPRWGVWCSDIGALYDWEGDPWWNHDRDAATELAVEGLPCDYVVDIDIHAEEMRIARRLAKVRR